MPADVNSPPPPSASRGEGELTSAGRLKIVENERRESQDGGGRARENWVEDKKARGGEGTWPSRRSFSTIFQKKKGDYSHSSSFRFQCRLLTMIIFLKIAV